MTAIRYVFEWTIWTTQFLRGSFKAIWTGSLGGSAVISFFPYARKFPSGATTLYAALGERIVVEEPEYFTTRIWSKGATIPLPFGI